MTTPHRPPSKSRQPRTWWICPFVSRQLAAELMLYVSVNAAARAQGAGGGVAAGESVPEERVPRGGGGEEDQAGRAAGRRRPVREGEHGRGAIPPEGGPADLRRLP
jgi:hypothetical protein